MRKTIDEIRKIVDDLIRKADTWDAFKVAKYLGIKVLFLPLENGKDGFWIQDGREKRIVINGNLPLDRQRLVCAHEIAHEVMHHEIGGALMRAYTRLSVAQHEIEANFFAFDLEFRNLDTDVRIEEVLEKYALKKEEIQLMYDYLEGQRKLDDYHTW